LQTTVLKYQAGNMPSFYPTYYAARHTARRPCATIPGKQLGMTLTDNDVLENVLKLRHIAHVRASCG
jgi:hypothetical protein